MSFTEIRRGKCRRDAQHSGTSCAAGGDPCRSVFNDKTLVARNAEPLGGQHIAVGVRLAARYILSADEDFWNGQPDAHKTELGQGASAGRHHCAAMIKNRAKESVRAGHELKRLAIGELEPFEPLCFRVGVQCGSKLSNRLDAASPVGTTDQIRDVQIVALCPALPRANHDGF